MRDNPINLILTGIAVADMLMMVEYIPFTVHMYMMDNKNREREERVNLVTVNWRGREKGEMH